MKILYLGPQKKNLIDFLERYKDTKIIQTEEQIVDDRWNHCKFDFVISYGYRYILKQDFVERYHHRIINLHIALLPWNRGADPNLWSFLEDTPKGVTIHYIDEGVDTGKIIAQKTVPYIDNDTLRTVYERLSMQIETLFKEFWPAIYQGNINSYRQATGGSDHRTSEKLRFEKFMTQGWDTPVKDLLGKALI